jgi:hypothetical protein
MDKDSYEEFKSLLEHFDFTKEELEETCIDEEELLFKFSDCKCRYKVHQTIIGDGDFARLISKCDSSKSIVRGFAEDIVSCFQFSKGIVEYFDQFSLDEILGESIYVDLYESMQNFEEKFNSGGINFAEDEIDSKLRDMIEEWQFKVADFVEGNEIKYDFENEKAVDGYPFFDVWYNKLKEFGWFNEDCKEYFKQFKEDKNGHREFVTMFYNSTNIPESIFLREIQSDFANIAKDVELIPEIDETDGDYSYKLYLISDEGEGFLIISNLNKEENKWIQ